MNLNYGQLWGITIVILRVLPFYFISLICFKAIPKKKELNLLEQQEKERNTQIRQRKEESTILMDQQKSELSEPLIPTTNIAPTLDAIRGIYFFTTLIGDKKTTKQQLELKLKEILLTPQGFGQFLDNISQYPKSL